MNAYDSQAEAFSEDSEEPIVWPPGPPRPYSWLHVFGISVAITTLVMAVVWQTQLADVISDFMNAPQKGGVFEALRKGFILCLPTGVAYCLAARWVAGKLEPGLTLCGLTSQDVAVWSFWISFLIIPTVFVLWPILTYAIAF